MITARDKPSTQAANGGDREPTATRPQASTQAQRLHTFSPNGQKRWNTGKRANLDNSITYGSKRGRNQRHAKRHDDDAGGRGGMLKH